MIYYFISGALAFGIIGSVWCRLRQMQIGVTRVRVFISHAGLALGAAAAVLVPVQYGIPAILAAVLLSLLAGAHRWAQQAPEETKKPKNIEPIYWPIIVGGHDKK